MIRHVSHEDIDKAQWDVVVHAAANATWYANSYVLDGMSPGWDALMDDATGAFIPLTKRRKYGIEYLYQPFALQQLGIFAPGPVDAGMTEAFLRAVPSAFRLVQIAGNAAMPRTEVPGWSFTASTNCTLDLSGGMQSVRSGYAKNTVRNLASSHTFSSCRRPPTGCRTCWSRKACAGATGWPSCCRSGLKRRWPTWAC